MNTLALDERYHAQVNMESVLPVSVDWSAGPSVKNVSAIVHSLLGTDYEINSEENLNTVKLSGMPVYDVLSQIFKFKSSQSRFFWKRFGYPYASKLQTANYPLEAQTKLLVFIFARLAGILGPDAKPNTPTMLTADGSTCEGSWAIPTGKKPVAGEPNRQVRCAIQPIDPRNNGFLRGTQVLEYLMSTNGGLGLIVVKDNMLTWLRKLEQFVFQNDENPDSDYVPNGTGFYLGLALLPSGLIALKPYYQCPAAGTEGTLKTPLYVTNKDFSPLAPLAASLHPSLVDQFQVMLDYFGSLEDRLKPLFHLLSVDIAAPEKNRLKIYFQTRVGLSFNDVKRNFTLGGRLDTPQMHENLKLMEMLWNDLFPQSPSWSGKDVTHRSKADNDHLQDHEQLPVSCFVWYYEFSANAPSLTPKVYFPAGHLVANDMEVCKVVEKFYNHPAVNITGPPDGEHTAGWVAREIQHAYTHRRLEDRPGITTWVTFGHKHTGFEMMAYFSSEQWAEEHGSHESDAV